MTNLYYKLFLILLLLINFSCIEESISVDETESFTNSGLLLRELEERGDFINSAEFPALVDADSVYSFFNEYIIIDVRSPEDFSTGHIINSVNVTKEDLYDYVTNLKTDNKKILLVSNTGQAAAYYLTLLRYADIQNIYSLRFGIAVWNRDFAHLWKDNLNNFIDDNRFNFTPQYDFNHIAQYFKPSPGNFPILPLSKQTLSQDEIAAERIKAVIKLGFDEKLFGEIVTENTVGIEYITARNYRYTNEFFIICFANAALYFRPQTSRGCLLQCSGHPWGTYLYNAFYPYGDLRSSADLQTIPANKTVVLYSFTGERSAMAVAYLKLFGYDAKSIIFGGHYLFHSRFITSNFHSSELLASFGIHENSFKNYPYQR